MVLEAGSDAYSREIKCGGVGQPAHLCHAANPGRDALQPQISAGQSPTAAPVPSTADAGGDAA